MNPFTSEENLLNDNELENVAAGGVISSSNPSYTLQLVQSIRRQYPQISKMSVSQKKAFLKSVGLGNVIDILGDQIQAL